MLWILNEIYVRKFFALCRMTSELSNDVSVSALSEHEY